MKDKRQKMTWPCGDPVLAAYVLQAAAANGAFPLPGLYPPIGQFPPQFRPPLFPHLPPSLPPLPSPPSPPGPSPPAGPLRPSGGHYMGRPGSLLSMLPSASPPPPSTPLHLVRSQEQFARQQLSQSQESPEDDSKVDSESDWYFYLTFL